MLNPLSIVRGVDRLGNWGNLELTGATSAVLRLRGAEDVDLAAGTAADLTNGVLLMNDELGRLLFLPYAGDQVVGFDIKEGELLCPALTLPRHDEHGLRMAVVHVLPGSASSI